MLESGRCGSGPSIPLPSDAAKRAVVDVENKTGQQRKEHAALIPIVGDGRLLKHARNDQLE